jgi:hypothetical protein
MGRGCRPDGYGADPQMSREFEQLPGFAHEDSGLIPPSLTGDGLVLGAEIGGIVHKVENSLRVMPIHGKVPHSLNARALPARI